MKSCFSATRRQHRECSKYRAQLDRPCNSPPHCPSAAAAAERKQAEDAVAAGSLPEEDIPEEDSHPEEDNHLEADNHPEEEAVDSSPVVDVNWKKIHDHHYQGHQVEVHRSCCCCCCWHHREVLEVDRSCRYCRKRTCWRHRSGLVADEQEAVITLVMGFREKKKKDHTARQLK